MQLALRGAPILLCFSTVPTPHYKVRRVSRKAGRTAQRAVQYAERGGYYASRADDVLGRGHAGPSLGDWSQVDAAEWRRDAVVARTRQANVPFELSTEGQMRVGQRHADWLRATFGIAAGFTLQAPANKPGSDQRNTHFHFYETTRTVDDAGNLGEKVRRLDLAHTVHMARQNYEDAVNEELRREGLSIRLDLRSFEKQGRLEKPLGRVPIIEFQRGRRGEPNTPNYNLNQAQLAHRAIARKNRQDAEKYEHTRRAITARLLSRRSTRRTPGRRAAGRTLDQARPRESVASSGLPAHRPGAAQLRHGDDDRGTQAPRPLAAAEPGHQRRPEPALPGVDGGRVADRDRGRGRAAAAHPGADGVGDRGQDSREPTLLPDVAAAPAVVRIDTLLGRTYFAQAQAIEAARTNGERDVPLCLADGSPLPADTFDRTRLRLSTIESANLTPPLPAPAPAQIHFHDLDPMKPADQIMLTNARRTVDLPGFLAAHGFTPNAEKDTRNHRILDGPGGQKVRVTVARSGDWVWEDLHSQGGGNIYHACTRLLGLTHGQAMGTVRKTVAAPPPPLIYGRGRTTATPRPPRTPDALGESGRRYLSGERLLHPDTLDAFNHALRQHERGVIFCHNRHGDGEERGPDGYRHFYGGQHDGEGRGRSLWVAAPHGSQEPPAQIIVAESGISGLSAWEMLDADAQPHTAIASTGGRFSAAGEAKLERVLARMVEHHREQGAPVLVDATDMGEKPTETRTAWLRDLAERTGAIYYRAVPTQEGVTDWNEELAALKAAREAQEAAQNAQRTASYLLPPEEQNDEQESAKIGGGGGIGR